MSVSLLWIFFWSPSDKRVVRSGAQMDEVRYYYARWAVTPKGFKTVLTNIKQEKVSYLPEPRLFGTR